MLDLFGFLSFCLFGFALLHLPEAPLQALGPNPGCGSHTVVLSVIFRHSPVEISSVWDRQLSPHNFLMGQYGCWLA